MNQIFLPRTIERAPTCQSVHLSQHDRDRGLARMVFPTRNTHVLTGHIGAVHCVTYSAGIGQYALTGGADRRIYLWNPTTASRIQEFKLHGYEVLDITVTSDNSTFASVGGDKQAFLWDVSTAKTLRRFEGHLSRINSAHFNNDGSILVTGSYDTNVMLWDTKSQSRKPIQVLEDAKDSISSVYILGHEIVTGSVDGRIRNYDIRMGRCFVDVIGYPVTCTTQSSDGNAILVSALDGGIRLIDKTNGQMLQSYRGHLNTEYRVRSCFGDGDKYIITGSEDGFIWVYDLLEGVVVDKMVGHKGKAATSVAYNPAGKKQMLSGGVDGAVYVWGE